MKHTRTLLDTIKSSDGNIITYVSGQGMYELIEGVHNDLLSLTEEEKHLYFTMITKYGEIIKKVFGEIDEEISSAYRNSNRAPGFLYDDTMNLSNDEWFNNYLSWKKSQQ